MIDYYLKELLLKDAYIEDKKLDKIVEQLSLKDEVKALYHEIHDNNLKILKIVQVYRESQFFIDAHFPLPNAQSKEQYEAILDLMQYPFIKIIDIEKLEEIGLKYNKEEQRIFGKPLLLGTHDINIVFYHECDKLKTPQYKKVQFIVNAHPRDLWKNISSDKSALYYKEDEATLSSKFLDKNIVIASKRGRSHAHEGTFRDDHFAVNNLDDGWAVVALADGAGSAKFARLGSTIATEFLVDSFADKSNNNNFLVELSQDVIGYLKLIGKLKTEPILVDPSIEENTSSLEEEKKSINYKSKIINALYTKIRDLYMAFHQHIVLESCELKDLNTTLIFALMKKFDTGYIVLTFSVGDCPINVIMPNFESVKLLNKLDVGDYGGGTRFITMPQIYNNEIGQRFNINFFENFDKMFLMTDGIYDPKFITENKLEDLETWKTFMADLDGDNEENIKVDFDNNQDIESKLLNWMDFWSKGNHDDRTLAIIY